MNIVYKILSLIFFVFTLAGCNTPYNQVTTAPPKPDSTTYLLKSYLFDSYNEEADCECYGENWTNAARKILVWRDFLNQNVIFNYKILAQIQQSDFTPEYYANNTWVYEFDYSFDSNVYEIEFYLTFQADSSVFWEIRSSTDDQNAEKIIEGETNKNNSLGYWIFYKQVFEPVTVLKIDWSKQDSVLNLTFHNILPDNYYAGSSLSIDKYTSSEKRFDLQITTTNSLLSDTSMIRANTNLYYGGIYSPNIYSDSLWHCWDSLKQDIECE